MNHGSNCPGCGLWLPAFAPVLDYEDTPRPACCAATIAFRDRRDDFAVAACSILVDSSSHATHRVPTLNDTRVRLGGEFYERGGGG